MSAAQEAEASDVLAVVEWPIRTERLVLRRMAAEDLEATWAFYRLPEVHRWLGYTLGDFEAYRERFLLPERMAVKLAVVHDERLIGELMIRPQDPWAQDGVQEQARGTQAEIGWIIAPEAQGNGFAVEAARAAVEACFGPLGLRRVVANCFADNEPSWRVMERLGMRREAHNVKDSLHATLGWLDNLTYALLAEEWPVGR